MAHLKKEAKIKLLVINERRDDKKPKSNLWIAHFP